MIQVRHKKRMEAEGSGVQRGATAPDIQGRGASKECNDKNYILLNC